MGVCTQGALRIPGESRPGSHIPTQGQPALSPPAPVLVWDLVAMLARGVAGMLGGGGGARGLSVLTGGPGRPLPCNAKHGVRACLGREEVAQHPPRPPELSGELLGMRRRSPDST